ncbi:hypothetical protein CKAH01_00907 [Colletotrichum kahawae]|uniref:Uncharacterized protein n=1 Tax=Colletotrichum kahawae TaxID=34407 RepID=A0AAE0DB93_COLKA|nr:hypothetical protein CKAH01_00907 [Colletotrichum kahawae]
MNPEHWHHRVETQRGSQKSMASPRVPVDWNRADRAGSIAPSRRVQRQGFCAAPATRLHQPPDLCPPSNQSPPLPAPTSQLFSPGEPIRVNQTTNMGANNTHPRAPRAPRNKAIQTGYLLPK